MHTFYEPTLPITEAIKPSTTTSSYVDPNYDYPIKGKSKCLFLFLNLKLNKNKTIWILSDIINFLLSEIEINTIEDCNGDSCHNNKVGRQGVSGNVNEYDDEGERHNNENGVGKNGKKRKR